MQTMTKHCGPAYCRKSLHGEQWATPEGPRGVARSTLGRWQSRSAHPGRHDGPAGAQRPHAGPVERSQSIPLSAWVEWVSSRPPRQCMVPIRPLPPPGVPAQPQHPTLPSTPGAPALQAGDVPANLAPSHHDARLDEATTLRFLRHSALYLGCSVPSVPPPHRDPVRPCTPIDHRLDGYAHDLMKRH